LGVPKKKVDIDKIEEEHVKKGNERRRKQLEKEYFDIKNLEIVLVDFVPYERKEDMIAGLKELFRKEGDKQPVFIDEPRFDLIPDIKEGGVFSGGGSVHLGWILNSDLDWQPMHAAAQKKLPLEFTGLDITLGQFVDFSYYIVYVATIKEKYQNDGIKRIFIESGDWVRYTEKTPDGKEIRGRRAKGPKFEPTIRKYQKVLEDFLRPYSCGLFLNKNSNKKLSCPNLKVLATPKIDFGSFKDWERKHIDFLRFTGFDITYSRCGNMLVGYYPERIFREWSIFEGLVFLASTVDFKADGYANPEHQICDGVGFLTERDLAPLLQLVYWTSFAMEIDRQKWEDEISSRLEEIRISREESLSIQQVYDKIIESYQRFGQFFIEENRNIESMKQYAASTRARITKMAEPIDSRFSLLGNVNVFEDLTKYADTLLEMEKDMLKHLKDQSDLLFSYSNNLTNVNLSQTNIRLQKSMKWMTWAMLILTGLATILTLLAYGSAIQTWLKNIFPQPYYNSLLIVLIGVFLVLFCYFVVRLVEGRPPRQVRRIERDHRPHACMHVPYQ